MTPPQQAAQLVADLSDVNTDVTVRAARRDPRHIIFVLDRDYPTALELLHAYAPVRLQLARGGSDDVDVIALRRDDGLTLLRAPRHHPTIFRVMAEQIAGDDSGDTVGVCVACGGFVRFAITRAELN